MRPWRGVLLLLAMDLVLVVLVFSTGGAVQILYGLAFGALLGGLFLAIARALDRRREDGGES